MTAEERARKLMERFGGEHPDLRPGFVAVTIEALTETILAAQREAVERCAKACMACSNKADINQSYNDGFVIATRACAQQILTLASEYGEESCTSE